MRKLFLAVKKIITEYTSGLPLFLWTIAGIGIGIFIFLFRNHGYINFDKLKYIILISAIWIIGSDILKKRRVLNKTFHFIADSVIYISLYMSIVYFSGGISGGLGFVFFLGAVSAPFFGSNLQTIIFLIALGTARYFIFYLTSLEIDAYYNAKIILEILLYFIMAGVIRFSLMLVNKLEIEKRVQAEKFVEECREEVKIKTQGLDEAQKQLKNVNIELEKKVLERTAELEGLKNNLEKMVEERTKELEEKVKELERFQGLMVGREIKMIELKKEIEKLKAK